MLKSVMKKSGSLRKPLVAKPKVHEQRTKKLFERRHPTVDLEQDEVDEQLLIGDILPVPEAAPIDPPSTNEDSRPNLCKMITDGRWTEIQELLFECKDVDIIVDDGTVTRDLIVHHACLHRAPVGVLRILASTYWKGLYYADKSGRFPIHVAALNGAGPGVLSFLINTNSAATGIKDTELGKTPLHYICENYVKKNKGGDSLKTQQNMFWAVGLLLKSAPSTVNIEDNEEMNPIEYAIAAGAHIGIIKEMQKASRSCWRARQKREGWKRHAEYAQYLQDQSRPACPLSKLTKSMSRCNTAA